MFFVFLIVCFALINVYDIVVLCMGNDMDMDGHGHGLLR
jgi:hypothetical protein